jgi:hypothetical protein
MTRANTSVCPAISFRSSVQLTALLFDYQTLKPKCVDALRRIFKLCDINKDGVLDPAELNEFQRRCFSSPLQLQEIDGLTRLIAEHDPSMVSLSPPGINEAGILYFHTRFIQQGRVDTIWIVLTSFGYGEDLELREEILRPRYVARKDRYRSPPALTSLHILYFPDSTSRMTVRLS